MFHHSFLKSAPTSAKQNIYHVTRQHACNPTLRTWVNGKIIDSPPRLFLYLESFTANLVKISPRSFRSPTEPDGERASVGAHAWRPCLQDLALLDLPNGRLGNSLSATKLEAVRDEKGWGTARAEDALGTPTHRHLSPNTSVRRLDDSTTFSESQSQQFVEVGSGQVLPAELYRATSLIRNRHPVGPHSRTMCRLLWRS